MYRYRKQKKGRTLAVAPAVSKTKVAFPTELPLTMLD